MKAKFVSCRDDVLFLFYMTVHYLNVLILAPAPIPTPPTSHPRVLVRPTAPIPNRGRCFLGTRMWSIRQTFAFSVSLMLGGVMKSVSF